MLPQPSLIRGKGRAPGPRRGLAGIRAENGVCWDLSGFSCAVINSTGLAFQARGSGVRGFISLSSLDQMHSRARCKAFGWLV